MFSGGRPAEYGIGGSTQEYVKSANANTLVCLMLEEVEAIDNLAEIATVKGIDVLFIGSGDLSQSMGYPGQPTHLEVQAVMEKGVKRIRDAGVVAGVSCPDALIPKFLGLGVQYFHGSVGRLLQTAGDAYLKTVRKAAGS
jgi:2-keto-3-deoxy-L-rhamnonate aldolase RhmA